jgi:pantothenate synthetase
LVAASLGQTRLIDNILLSWARTIGKNC